MSYPASVAFTNNSLAKELLICSECKGFLQRPRLLPCQHSFCTSCLQSHFARLQSESEIRLGAFPCPLCHSIVELPRGGVTAYPEDIRSEKLKEFVENLTAARIIQCHSRDNPNISQATKTATATQTDFNPEPLNASSRQSSRSSTSSAKSSSHKKVGQPHNTEEHSSKDQQSSRGEKFRKQAVTSVPDFPNPDRGSNLVWEFESFDYNMPTSMAFLPDGGLVVAEYGNSMLQFYSEEGLLLRRSEHNVKPYSVIVDYDDFVVVGDRKDKTLKVFDQNGECLTQFDKNTFPWVGGIAVNSRREFIVFDRTNYKVSTYNPDGIKLSDFGLSPILSGMNRTNPALEESQFCMANFLAVDSHDRIIVCDSGNHCVKIFDPDGNFQLKSGNRGARNGLLEWPKGVAMANGDNILVTDALNERVSLFSSDGLFIRHIMESTRACNVAFKAPNQLALSQYSLNGYSKISVYEMLQ